MAADSLLSFLTMCTSFLASLQTADVLDAMALPLVMIFEYHVGSQYSLNLEWYRILGTVRDSDCIPSSIRSLVSQSCWGNSFHCPIDGMWTLRTLGSLGDDPRGPLSAC
jgi:hypothetical protein